MPAIHCMEGAVCRFFIEGYKRIMLQPWLRSPGKANCHQQHSSLFVCNAYSFDSSAAAALEKYAKSAGKSHV